MLPSNLPLLTDLRLTRAQLRPVVVHSFDRTLLRSYVHFVDISFIFEPILIIIAFGSILVNGRQYDIVRMPTYAGVKQ